MKMYETITTVVTIGKSKKPVAYTFLKSDFIRIEDDVLILKSDERTLRVDPEDIRQILLQMNGM